jgi:uncharacterized repeat protein (TIGR03803 family)
VFLQFDRVERRERAARRSGRAAHDRRGILTTLYSFCSEYPCNDGDYVVAGLVQGTDGSFYGTTYSGGTYEDEGTVFRLSMGLAPFVETQQTSGPVGAAVKILGQSDRRDQGHLLRYQDQIHRGIGIQNHHHRTLRRHHRYSSCANARRPALEQRALPGDVISLLPTAYG